MKQQNQTYRPMLKSSMVPQQKRGVMKRWAMYGFASGLGHRYLLWPEPTIQIAFAETFGGVLYGLSLFFNRVSDGKQNYTFGDFTKRFLGYQAGVILANVDRVIKAGVEYAPLIQEGLEQLVK